MKLNGMRERTIRIGSAGKTFSLTGFRIGYVTGPAALITGVMKAHQHLAYTSPAPLQKAVAMGLNLGDDYYERFVADMQNKRDQLDQGLKSAGFKTLPCEGTYFITVDIRSVGHDDDAASAEKSQNTQKWRRCPSPPFIIHRRKMRRAAMRVFVSAKNRKSSTPPRNGCATILAPSHEQEN